jgi:alpha-galactosidase
MSDLFIFKTKQVQTQAYTAFDPWQKDDSGNWGKGLGTVQGSLRNVSIGAHQTKVWKVIPQSTTTKRQMLHEL